MADFDRGRYSLREVARAISIKRDRLSSALVEKDYSPIWHGLCVLAIIVAASFLFYKSFSSRGTILFTDMPWWNLERIRFQTTNLWYPYGSFPSVGGLQWLFWTYPTSTLAMWLGLSESRYVFAVYLGTFSLAGISMYVLSFKTIKKVHFEKSAGYAPYIGGFVAALIYMYNPWSIQYLRPYYAYPVYALTPLVFLFMVRVFKKPSFRNIFLFSLLVTFANTSHHVLWFLSLVVSYFLFFLVVHRFSMKSWKNALKVLFGFIGFYFLLNATWTFPYLGALLSGKPFLPYYSQILTPSMLSGLSAHNFLMNNFRLLSFWAWTLNMVPGGIAAQVITFTIPAFAILSLLVVRKWVKSNLTVVYWSTVAILALLLGTGTSFILGKPYNYLVFHAPGSSFYGWMLRGAEKWLFFVPVFFSLIIGLFVARLLVSRPTPVSLRSFIGIASDDERARGVSGGEVNDKGPGAPSDRGNDIERVIDNVRFRCGVVVAIIVSVLVVLSMFPVASDWAKKVFSPADVPRDYQKVSDFINRHGRQPRVTWLPFFPQENYNYTWAPEKAMLPNSVFNSNPSINDIMLVNAGELSYFNWFQNLYLQGRIPPMALDLTDLTVGKDMMSRLLAPLAASYLIYDRSVTGFDFGGAFNAEKSLKEAYRTKYLSVYATQEDPGYVWAATRTVEARSFFDNLALQKNLSGAQAKNLCFTDGKTYWGKAPRVSGKYGGLDMAESMTQQLYDPGFEDKNREAWRSSWTVIYDNPRVTVTVDRKEKRKGKQSLKVTNTSDAAFDMGWIAGNGVPATGGDIFAIDCDVKCENAEWTMVTADGLDERTGQWQRLIRSPNVLSGDNPWKEYYGSFRVPDGFSQVRVSLGGGWKKDKAKGDAVNWFDNVKLLKLDPGFINKAAAGESPPKVTFTKKSAECIRVRVRGAKKPFVLVLGETYDRLWKATTQDGKTYEPIPLYSTITGFKIDKTGTFDLVIEYPPQRWFLAGLAVSITTILLCLAGLLYAWKVRSGRKPEWHKKVVAATKTVGYRFRLFGTRISRYSEAPPRRR